jgi:hypothetical protein
VSPHAGQNARRSQGVGGIIRKRLPKDLFFELYPADLHGYVQHQEWQRRKAGVLQQDPGNRGLLDQIERMPDDRIGAAGDQLARLRDQAELPAQG